MITSWLSFLFLPFMLSLLGRAQMPRLLCAVASALALMLSVEPYACVLPWALGMAIAAVSVWARLQEPGTGPKKRGGIAPAAPNS